MSANLYIVTWLICAKLSYGLFSNDSVILTSNNSINDTELGNWPNASNSRGRETKTVHPVGTLLEELIPISVATVIAILVFVIRLLKCRRLRLNQDEQGAVTIKIAAN